MVFVEHVEVMIRVHDLINREATGSSIELARKLNVSKAKVYRIISTMKSLNAPIDYDFAKKTFFYTEKVDFNFGFYHRL